MPGLANGWFQPVETKTCQVYRSHFAQLLLFLIKGRAFPLEVHLPDALLPLLDAIVELKTSDSIQAFMVEMLKEYPQEQGRQQHPCGAFVESLCQEKKSLDIINHACVALIYTCRLVVLGQAQIIRQLNHPLEPVWSMVQTS